MKSYVRIDQAGRIVLPKAVREELGISAGDTLDVVVQGTELTLRPRSSSRLEKERGVWVFRTGQPLTGAETRQVLEEVRATRSSGGESR